MMTGENGPVNNKDRFVTCLDSGFPVVLLKNSPEF